MVLYFIVLRPLAWGSGFYLNFEKFQVISMVDKSQDHGKVLSIFVNTQAKISEKTGTETFGFVFKLNQK